MNQLAAFANEKLGRSFYKLLLMRNTGQVTLPNGKKVTHWRLVKSHYFSPRDTFYKMDKDHAYELHLENEDYNRREGHIFKIDLETGASINGYEQGAVCFTPKELAQRIDPSDIKTAVMAAKGLGIDWKIAVALVGVGVAIGLFMGISSIGDSINHALQGNSTQVHAVLAAVLR